MPLVERALKHRERGVPTSNRAREKGSKAITLDEPLLGDPLQGGHSSSLRPTIFIQRDNLLLSYDTIFTVTRFVLSRKFTVPVSQLVRRKADMTDKCSGCNLYSI